MSSTSINPSIFHAYDIRGIYPENFNKEAAYQIGRVFADYTKVKNVLIGRDMRLSSPEIFKGLSQGLIEQGADVFDAGLVPIDFIYSMVPKNNFNAGIMITASHNPKGYNGLKMILWQRKPWVEPISGELIKKLIDKNIKPAKKKGKIKKINLWRKYLSHIFSFVDLKKIKPLKIVVDAGNGLAGKVIPLMAKKIPCRIIPLFFKLDGNFPNHPSNPFEKGAMDKLIKKVVKERADFGVFFDGDTDRIVLVDEKGEPLFGDFQLLLLAKKFLKEYPKSAVVYKVDQSRAVKELIKKMGGKPIRTKVGYFYTAKAMRENKAILGGETSCHFAFKDNFYADSGFIAFLIFLEIISQSDKKLSELVKEFKIYSKIHIPAIKVKNKEKVIEFLKRKHKNGKIDQLDGLTVEYNNWWFNLRPSNTEPVIRLTIEAKTNKLLKEKLSELKKLIKNL